MKREKRLVVNTILYFLGSSGKGLLPIVIVLLGSHYINPAELGTYDIVFAIISLLQPIIIFQINDAVYRWLVDNKTDKSSVIKIGFAVLIRNMAALIVILCFVKTLIPIDNFALISCLLILNCIYPVLQQITRGLKHHKLYAVSGIFNAIVIMFISIVCIGALDMGVAGIYLSQIIGTLFSIVILVERQFDVFRVNYHKPVDKTLEKEMMAYSIMLIPNSINQWLIKGADKYFILYFMGTFSNGIYSVAHRFPELLLMVNNMFYSAWVEQSIVERDSKDKNFYFTKIFDFYSNILFGIVLILMPISKYVVRYTVGTQYLDSWKYVSILYIGVIFSAFSSFFGTGYLSSKKTSGIMKTSFWGVLVNCVINFLFMKRFGIQVAAVSSLCSYLFMWLYRVKETQVVMEILIKWKKIIMLTIFLFIEAVLINFTDMAIDIAITVLNAAVAIRLNKILLIQIRKNI